MDAQCTLERQFLVEGFIPDGIGVAHNVDLVNLTEFESDLSDHLVYGLLTLCGQTCDISSIERKERVS